MQLGLFAVRGWLKTWLILSPMVLDGWYRLSSSDGSSGKSKHHGNTVTGCHSWQLAPELVLSGVTITPSVDWWCSISYHQQRLHDPLPYIVPQACKPELNICIYCIVWRHLNIQARDGKVGILLAMASAWQLTRISWTENGRNVDASKVWACWQ